MGKAVKSVSRVIPSAAIAKASGLGSMFGLEGSATYKPQTASKKYFDISKEVKPAQDEFAAALARQKGLTGITAPAQADVLKQMGEAALGRGPSLAEAQLKQAQDRNLAQQLAATQSRPGGGALAQRSLLQNMASSGRDLAQQSAIERLRERDAFLGQANLAEQGLRQDVSNKLNVDLMPKQSLQAWETGRVGIQNEAARLQAAQNAAGRGALLGGIATVAGGAVGGPMGASIGSGFGKAATPTPPVGKAEGGHIKGPGTGKSDSIPAFLSNGEFVVKADVVKKPGVLDYLMKLNDGEEEMYDKKPKKYKSGGLVKDEHTPKGMEVIDDKGFGKIIIISKNKEDKNKYAEGGLVKPQSSLAEALMRASLGAQEQEEEMASKREDVDSEEKKRKLIDAIKDMHKTGPRPLTPAGKKASTKKQMKI